jgi:negative regulator of replication initiation
MKKFLTVCLLITSLVSLIALERFEEVLIQKAVYPEQKQAVKKYLEEKARHLREEAQSLKEAAEVKKGGKKVYQKNVKQQTLRKVESLESKAKEYEKAAARLKVQEKQE